MYFLYQLLYSLALFSPFLYFLSLLIIFLLPNSLSIFMIITLNSLSCRLLISTLLSSSGVLSYSFFQSIVPVSSFYLILCVYFYVLGRSVTFPSLGEVVLCRRHLWGPTAHSPLVTRVVCSRRAPYVGFVGPSVLVALTTVDTLVNGATPAWLATRPSLTWWPLACW